MSILSNIVAVCGGNLHVNGCSAHIPAPGHSPKDRSVSLTLNKDGRILIYCFSDVSWFKVRTFLIDTGLTTRDDFVTGQTVSNTLAPGIQKQKGTKLYKQIDSFSHGLSAWRSREIVEGSVAQKYLEFRGLRHLIGNSNFGFHPNLRMSSDPNSRSYSFPCLTAKITDANGLLSGIQATFFFNKYDFSKKRRLIYGKQKGNTISLDAVKDELLIGEGVETTASASMIFGVPSLSMINSQNLKNFHAPIGLRRLIIAHDNEAAGIAAAHQCAQNNKDRVWDIQMRTPHIVGDDWNDVWRNWRERKLNQG